MSDSPNIQPSWGARVEDYMFNDSDLETMITTTAAAAAALQPDCVLDIESEQEINAPPPPPPPVSTIVKQVESLKIDEPKNVATIRDDILYSKRFCLASLTIMFFRRKPRKACLMTANNFILTDCDGETDWKMKLNAYLKRLNVTDLVVVGQDGYEEVRRLTYIVSADIRVTVDDLKYRELLYPCKDCKSKSCILRISFGALKRYIKKSSMVIPHTKVY